MKRRNFIKTLAAACAVPVVAARAVASRGGDRKILFKNGSTIKLREFPNSKDEFEGWYDQSGNGNHALKDVWFDGQQGKINLHKFKGEIEWIKPEDAPLAKSLTSTR